jgi:DNA-directed RNA polymerase subunit beta'
MAVHLPLSAEAQAEARVLMLSSNNILSPAHGSPLATPTQDMVLGTYYLTYGPEEVDLEKLDREKSKPHVFRTAQEAELSYEHGMVKLHDLAEFRAPGREGGHVLTTVGRIIFNDRIERALEEALGEEFDRATYRFINKTLKKRDVTGFVDELIQTFGASAIALVLDAFKDLGFHYATQAGVTISKNDVLVPPSKEEIHEKYEKEVRAIQDQYEEGLITQEERHLAVTDKWNAATEEVADAMIENIEGADQLNSIYMMANSGARGSFKQIRQLAGMRGLMANPKGEIIERPIKSNFMEGLSVLEYFISTHGARKGLADTALRTADSGYLTRRLVDVSQDVIIREDDCKTTEHLEVPVRTPDGLPNRSGLLGRVIAIDHKISRLQLSAGDEINGALLRKIADAAGEKPLMVPVRTTLKCKADIGVCRKCYGWSMATGKMSELGDAVGTVAAQSIGEPGTQLTMRTFHTGGVAGLDITHGLPRVVELFEARKPKAAATLAEIGGRIKITEAERGWIVSVTPSGEEDAEEYSFPRRTRLRVAEGESIEAGTPLNEGPLAPTELLDLRDDTETARYLVGEVQDVYKSQGVEIHDKHIELIVRQMLKKVRIDNSGDSDYLPGELVDRPELERTLRALKKGKKERPTHTQLILGITKASLATQSFLSAASFQETTKVLTDAAIEGKIDHLVGLKENVIIGKLIPAATGLREYRAVTIEPSEDAPRFLVDEFTTPVYTDALVGDGDGAADGAGLIDLTPKPGAEEPFIPPVPEEE